MAKLPHKAKSTKSSPVGRVGRNKDKCERYRRRVGRPAGRGVAGNKAGKNRR